ncbi:MAG: glycosyltransferase family 39 protein [Chloroflexota bacterium]|nr:glycosyltransferase family 39 protein [Chloroflexota bacterium]
MRSRTAGRAVALLTLLALALRVARLDFQPLWWDEGYSVWFANQPLIQMLLLTAEDIHPPLYYTMLGGWSSLFGLSPVALRLFSVAAGVLAIPLIYLVGRWLGGPITGVLAAFLLAINPFHIFYSQEVRMYALVTLYSLMATGSAARWLGVRFRSNAAGQLDSSGYIERTDWAWLLGYLLFIVLALYTQYYAGFLAAGLTVAGLWLLWRRKEPGKRAVLWLAAQAVALLLYLPWLLFATPRLVAYVSQKVVADSDRPLGAIEYLARHLSAFSTGHLEGLLTRWWVLGLLGLLPLFWALLVWWSERNSAGKSLDPVAGDSRRQPAWETVGFLLLALLVVLMLGWLVNLTFPFFPDRAERLLLLALPLFLLLISTALVCAWNSVTRRQLDGSDRNRLPLVLTLILFAGLSLLSLLAFFTVPRYAEEDYRPLIGQVNQWGKAEDRVISVFPWQVGYFWSYGRQEGAQPILLPPHYWNDEAVQLVDDALENGNVWFPEHLSLGGLLESQIEDYLWSNSYNLANRWYSPSTRLTGWASPDRIFEFVDAGDAAFANGVQLADSHFGPSPLPAANQTLLVDLAWENKGALSTRAVSLRLADDAGHTWAQQDLTAHETAGPDRLAMLVPAGTPPGEYELRLGLSEKPGGPAFDFIGPDGRTQGTETILGQVRIERPDDPQSIETLAFDIPVNQPLGDAVDLLGYSVSRGPLTPGHDLQVNLFWQALPDLGQIQNDLHLFLQLVDGDERVAAAWQGPPVSWYPTGDWQAGELVRSQHLLRLPAGAMDGKYALITGLFDPQTGQRLPKSGQVLGSGQDFIHLAEFEAVDRDHVMTSPQLDYPFAADLQQLGRLVGYGLSSDTFSPGESLEVDLIWQATETTGERLSVFVHLLDDSGNFIAQSDGEPGEGNLPTSSWVPGEYLSDRHLLPIPPDCGNRAGCPEQARIVVGIYDPTSGTRLLWVDADGQPVADSLDLPTPVGIRRD